VAVPVLQPVWDYIHPFLAAIRALQPIRPRFGFLPVDWFPLSLPGAHLCRPQQKAFHTAWPVVPRLLRCHPDSYRSIGSAVVSSASVSERCRTRRGLSVWARALRSAFWPIRCWAGFLPSAGLRQMRRFRFLRSSHSTKRSRNLKKQDVFRILFYGL